MGICCGTNSKKPEVKYEPSQAHGQKGTKQTIDAQNPPSSDQNGATATQTGLAGGHEKTLITESYLNELGGGHLYGIPGAPILKDDKSKKNIPSNHPSPPVPEKVLPHHMPQVDLQKPDLPPNLIQIWNGTARQTPNSPAFEYHEPQKIVVSPPVNPKPEPTDRHHRAPLEVIQEKSEKHKTWTVISVMEADNSPQKPSIVELKPVPEVLPGINKAHFDSVTSKIMLLNPSTLKIEAPEAIAHINSIRPLPWVGPDAFDFISCNHVLTTGLGQNSAVLGAGKPDGRIGVSRFGHLVQLPAAFQTCYGGLPR